MVHGKGLLALFYDSGEKNLFVGWGPTHVGGFPDLSDVALERSGTQQ
jgi:hypothetical protein